MENLRSRMIGFFVFASIAGCGQSPGTGNGNSSILNGVPFPDHPEIVLLEIVGGVGDCSGVFVGRNLIMTAEHCIHHFLPANAPWHTIVVWNGNAKGLGTPNQVSSPDRIHASTVADIALLETDDKCVGSPLAVAQGANLPTPATIGGTGFSGQPVDVVGFSNNGVDAGIGAKERRQGTMTIAGITSATENAFMLEPTEFQVPGGQPTKFQVYHSDSGGPVLKNGEVVGIISGHATTAYTVEGRYYPCVLVANYPESTFSCLARAAYIDSAFVTQWDPDGDGIGSTMDNCPNDPNADQRGPARL